MSKKKKQYDSDNYFSYKKGDTGHILGLDFTKNPEQRELIRLMNDNSTPIIFCIGDAGTGKTFTSIAAAIDLVKVQKKYSKIFYIRTPIDVGNVKLGYLPGDIDDKYNVYLGGLQDNLFNISELTAINVHDMKSAIECVPPQYCRGRSWENVIIICDETQNMDLDTIQALCTRIGKYCKLVFLGSMKQIDVKGKTKSNNDFKTAIDIFNTMETKISSTVELLQSERSPYCRMIDEAF